MLRVPLDQGFDQGRFTNAGWTNDSDNLWGRILGETIDLRYMESLLFYLSCRLGRSMQPFGDGEYLMRSHSLFLEATGIRKGECFGIAICMSIRPSGATMDSLQRNSYRLCASSSLLSFGEADSVGPPFSPSIFGENDAFASQLCILESAQAAQVDLPISKKINILNAPSAGVPEIRFCRSRKLEQRMCVICYTCVVSACVMKIRSHGRGPKWKSTGYSRLYD